MAACVFVLFWIGIGGSAGDQRERRAAEEGAAGRKTCRHLQLMKIAVKQICQNTQDR